ncbi:hypothetical protein EPN96_07785 [bacterium]|nr:MAG: hypothetical protein EPN96_07785 [bacterium]
MAPAAVAVLCFFAPGLVFAAEYTAEATYTKEGDRKADESGSVFDEKETRKFTFGYDHKTSYDFNVKLGYELSRAFEDKEEDFDTLTTDHSVKGEAKATWWSAASEWSQSITESDDPETDTEIDTTLKFEAKAEPKNDILPDAAFTYERSDETVDKAYEGAFEYKLLKDLVEFSLDAKKDTSTPRSPEEDKTDDRSFAATAKFKTDLGDAWKFDAEAKHQRDQGLTLDSDDRLLDKSDTLTNEAKAKLEFKTIEWVDFAVTQENKWDKDFMVEEPTEVSRKWEGEVKVSPKPSEFIDVKADYVYTLENKEGTDADTTTTSQGAGAELTYKPLDIVSLLFSYDWTYDHESPEDESSIRKRKDEYKLESEWKVWEDQIKFKATRNFSYEWENGDRTNTDVVWDFEGNLELKDIPGLELKPVYTVSADSGKESKWEVAAKYTIELGDVTKFSVDHKYSRTATYPEEEVNFIKREDDTKFALELKDFFKNMTAKAEYGHKASDESEDDAPPEFEYTLDLSYGWKALGIYDFAVDHGYTRNSTSEDKKSYDVSLSFPIYRDHLKFKFEYGFETQIEGEKNDSESYLVEVSGKF